MEFVSLLRKTAAAFCAILAVSPLDQASFAADFNPAPQRFRQEVAHVYGESDGLPPERVQLIECAKDGIVRAFAAGRWYSLHEGRWSADNELVASDERQFGFADASGRRIDVPIPWREVRQLL